jgi:hypothetical protein
LDDTTSASTNPVSSKAVYKTVTDNELVWTNAFVALSGAVSSHTENTEIHVTSADKEKLQGIAAGAEVNVIDTIKVNGTAMAVTSKAVDIAVPTKTSDITNDSNFAVDASYVHTDNNYTTAEKNKLSGIAAGAEVNVNADWNAESGDAQILNKPTLGTAAAKSVSAGITNTDSLIESRHIYSGVGVTIAYDSTSKLIQLKSTSGNVLSSFDATAFIKDGMVSNVEINGGNLVITFNSDSDKEAISIPLTSIFNPNNYYTKSETSGSTQIQTALNGKSNTGHTHTISDVTNLQSTLNGKANAATTLSGYGITDAKIANGVITLGSNTITPLTSHQSLSDYYKKSELTGTSTTVVVAKAASATTAANATTASSVAWGNVSGKPTLSSATEVNTALSGKVDATEYATFSASTNDSIDDLSGQSETIAAALNNLNENKADLSTTLSGYGITDAYTKTEIDNMIGNIETLLAAI